MASYIKCERCGVDHTIALNPKNLKVQTVSEDGQEGEHLLPAGIIYIRATTKKGNFLYFPRLNPRDDVVEGHTETFEELWRLHDLPASAFEIEHVRSN